MTALPFRRWRGLLLLLSLPMAACGLFGGKPPPAPELPPVVAPTVPPPPPPKIALALGGGAARGFAHIGVIKVLESHGLKPEMVVGTSAGSVAGALYSAGYSGFDLQQMAFDLDRATVSDWTLFGKGLIKGDALRHFINGAVKNKTIQQLKPRFACVAVKLKTGEAVLFERGETGLAVQASSAVPGVFAPARIGDEDYVDGGLVSVVPIRYARQMGADFVIAVDVAAPPDQREAQGKLDVVMRTFGIMGKTIRESEYPLADVVVVPDMRDVTSTDFEGKHRAILAGERAAQAALPELRAKLKARGLVLE
ncbi:patatin-like phospholipase family protein [Stagnimonas aquatica]|uniref:Patatin-like phospholipase family protein n=1 Tax=Stagnimonas aquatica TaxID=2689987 RepID=A0A3N0V5G2_9GAMM|nr:patatin-like phospholipase family protein [Stagnimonas aquatica]ROH87832.1 patatin-like phospholipase family protein [Stagnimonas aquatica]